MRAIHWIFCFCLVLTACTPQPRGVRFVHSPSLLPMEIPAIPKDKARVFIYHEFQGFLAGNVPPVPLRIDGVTIGRFPIEAAMFWDVAPGQHRISVGPSFADQWGIEIVRDELLMLSIGEEAFVKVVLEYNPILRKPVCPSFACVWVEIEANQAQQEFFKDRIRHPIYKNIQ